MKKLIQLLLLVPLISFCQEDEKFDGVVKINKYANFIQKVYYPNSPFENPFDSLFVIGGISTASGKKFDIIGNDPVTSAVYFRTDMPIQPELYEKFTFNSLRKQLERRNYFSTMQNGDRNLICNYILRNIDKL